MQRKISLKSLAGLSLNSTGLSEIEYSQQKLKFGPNEIVSRATSPWAELIIDTIKDPMVWFLVGIATVFYLIGEFREAIVLFSATLPLIFMDAFLHWRTQASTSSLKSQLSSKASVIRDGVKTEVDLLAVVPGDLVILSTENPFLPADGYWEKASALKLDESILTGEAFPVDKSSIQHDQFSNKDEAFINSNLLGFAGTRVLTGTGELRVFATGKSTNYGEIILSVTNLNHEKTPLQSAILELTRSLLYGAIVFCLALAVIRYYQGHGWLDSLLSAAVLAVAAIPEEFPVVFSFFLGVGVYRLAKRHALVRRAVSVENIGRVTQICTDKTGTITFGELNLTHLDPAAGVSEQDFLLEALIASNIKGTDPVDMAILKVAVTKEITPPQRWDVSPFTEDRKREAAFSRRKGAIICVIKGSPEIVLSKSVLKEEEIIDWNKKVNSWAKGGHKVLALASIEVTESLNGPYIEPESGFQFKGLLAFEDPARPEINDAIKYCHQHGIKVLMVTGDHPETASAIAMDVGLTTDRPLVISAEQEPHKLEPEWLQMYPDFFKNIDIVARCNPLQKLKIVESLKNLGEMVIVTGDGINDVPALKAADIGVAMGLRGTRSAKEVSSIILADDNFSTIVNAIREGKQLFKNLKMSFKYLLLFHIPFVLSAAIIPLMGYPLLYRPIHVVWLELIIHPTALFAFQQPALKDQAISAFDQKSFFTRREVFMILTLGAGLTIVLILFYVDGVIENPNIDYGRAKVMALLSLWSAGIALVLTKARTLSSKILIITTIATALTLIQSHWWTQIFYVTPLGLLDWIKVFVVVITFLVALFFANRKLI